MKIYGDVRSGNCDKVRFAADFLNLPYVWIEIDSVAGKSRAPEFLAKNPQGQVPFVEFEDGRCLAQSNAILRFIAEGTPLLPGNAWTRAKIDEWLFWEQNSHELFVAGCIGHMTYKGQPKETREPWRVERAEKALDHMEAHLRQRQWLIGETVTIADVALLAYTRNAHKGGFDMTVRPNVQAWIARSTAALGLQPASA